MAAGLPNVRDLGWFLLRIRVQQAKIRWPKSLGSLIWVPMRKRFEVQLTLGKTPIEKVLLPLKSRDELPPILAGLKWIFLTPEINAQVFTLLEEKLVAGKKATGRPGLDLWQILVLGVVRLGLDCDYDRLEHLANYDSLLRQILGLSPVRTAEEKPFHYKTLSENICHVDDELLEQINAIVVQAGRAVFKKKDGGPAEPIFAKTDSYVLETNVHFPTDLNLLWDAQRKCIDLAERLGKGRQLEGWRKDQHGLILDYERLEFWPEVGAAIPVADRLLSRYGEGNIASLSFDKGFSRAEDRELLELYIPQVIMPKRGQLNRSDEERESGERFRALRHQHAAVESDINCLEHHGLNRCLDKGLNGFERYIGFGVLAYNLHKIGARLLQREREKVGAVVMLAYSERLAA